MLFRSGSIYAADTDHFSLAAVPQIADLAAKHRSVLVAGRHMPSPAANAGPVFYAPRGGMGELVDAVAREAERMGAVINTAHPVQRLERPEHGKWHVEGEHFDAVILAVPAPAAARLVQGVAVDAAHALASIPTADVAMVTLAVPSSSWPQHLSSLSGYLVPKPQQRQIGRAHV